MTLTSETTSIVPGSANACANSSVADETNCLVGNWKLVSSQVIVDNKAQDLFGLNPKGYLTLTPQGRLFAITTAEHREPGNRDIDRAALHRSMLAYTGKYRVEGSDFITVVDASWNEAWNGTEQKRHFQIEGDKLLIESAPAPSILFPGRVDFRRVVWEREK
jgi:lipocalin-like protein